MDYRDFMNYRDLLPGASRTVYTAGICPCGTHYAPNHISGYFAKWLLRGTVTGFSCTLKAINLRYIDLPAKERVAREEF